LSAEKGSKGEPALSQKLINPQVQFTKNGMRQIIVHIETHRIVVVFIIAIVVIISFQLTDRIR
jgi:hypothetical protein